MPSARIPATGEVIQTTQPTRSTPAPAVLYVNKVASDGWLQARAEGSGERLSLSKYTRLTNVQTRGGRIYFKAAEGVHQGRTLSLAQANAQEYLGNRAPTAKATQLTVTYGKYESGWYSEARGDKLDQQLATLEIDAVVAAVTMNSVWGTGFTPLPPGQYKVLLPDVPHGANMTRPYRRVEPALVFDQVWFPIQHGDNSRYVHIGNLSDGCVTVMDFAKWPAIHEALLSHRSPDGKSVAQLTVKGKPQRER